MKNLIPVILCGAMLLAACGSSAGGQQGGCQYGSGQCFQFHMCFSLVM